MHSVMMYTKDTALPTRFMKTAHLPPVCLKILSEVVHFTMKNWRVGYIIVHGSCKVTDGCMKRRH